MVEQVGPELPGEKRHIGGIAVGEVEGVIEGVSSCSLTFGRKRGSGNLKREISRGSRDERRGPVK